MLVDPGRILALDIGDKRTGVALSDEGHLIATPHSTIEAKSSKDWALQIRQLVEETEAIQVVVGLPLNQFGEIGRDAQKIRSRIALLQSQVNIPVVEWDERFTTIQAERTLLEADLSRKKRKQVIDKVAAAIILQSYLDSHSH